MDAVTNKGAIKTITTHYIGGTFVGSHGREVMDISSTRHAAKRSPM
jgi:hypothetical protein